MRRAHGTRLLLSSGALAISGGIALATGPGEEPPPRDGRASVQQVDREQAARFAITRRERAAADRLPDAAAEFVRSTVTPDNGAAPGLARRASSTPSGDAVFVIPADGVLCTYVTRGSEGGGGCNRTEEAIAGFLVDVSSPAPGISRVVGVVPDGVNEVSLRAEDGSVERASVAGNVYVFETGRLPSQVEFGDTVVPLRSPPA